MEWRFHLPCSKVCVVAEVKGRRIVRLLYISKALGPIFEKLSNMCDDDEMTC